MLHSPKMSELTDGRGCLVSTISFTKKGIHMRNNIRIYEVKSEYIKYFAPLSSFKDKHKQMKEGVDIDINKEKNASYRYLLQAESREVNRQKNRIRKNAEIVYSHKKQNGVTTPLAKRTNDFNILEKLCREY